MELIDALTNEAMLELAWEDHGFRGPLGTIGKTQSPMLHTRMTRLTLSYRCPRRRRCWH